MFIKFSVYKSFRVVENCYNKQIFGHVCFFFLENQSRIEMTKPKKKVILKLLQKALNCSG